MSRSQFITRKEIAAANEVSDDTIARRERSLGLNSCRDRACQKPVRYHRSRAAECLRAAAMNEPD